MKICTIVAGVFVRAYMNNKMSFSELIRSEEELLERLLSASQRQLKLVDEGQVTLLIQHLGLRQHLWNEFEQLELQLAPYRGIPPEKRVWNNAEERQKTEAAVNRCKDLMEQILANDQQSLSATATQKDEVEAQLRRVRRATTVAPAYLKQSQLK